MSDAFLLKTGGSSGGISEKYAVIHIHTESGSTITLKKGDAVIKILGAEKAHISESDSGYADWYYSVKSSNYGNWTVIASKNGNEETSTITVDSVKQYDVELLFNLYIIKDGISKITIDGAVSVLPCSDLVRIRILNGHAYVYLTPELLKNRSYSKLILEFEAYPVQFSPNDVFWGIRTNHSGGYKEYWLQVEGTVAEMTFPYRSELDISNIDYVNKYFDMMTRYTYPEILFSNIYLSL